MANRKILPYTASDITAAQDVDIFEFVQPRTSNPSITEAFTVPASLQLLAPAPVPGSTSTITVDGNPRTIVKDSAPIAGQVRYNQTTGLLDFHSSDSGLAGSITINEPYMTWMSAAHIEWLQANTNRRYKVNDDPTFGDITSNLVDSAAVLGNEMAIDGTSVVRFYPPNFGSNIGKSASDLGVTIQSTNGFVAIGMGPYLRAGSILSDIEVDYYGDQTGDTLAMILQSQDVANGSDPAGTRTTRVSGSVNPPSTGYYGTAAFSAGYTVLDKVHYMRLTGTYSAGAMQIFEIRLIFSKQVL